MNIPVTKALSPEETAILGNIKSLITELEGGGAVPGGEEGAPVMMSDETGSEIPGAPQNTVAKDESGRSTAESKVDELPVDDEEALGVLKALLAKSSGGSHVAKSRQSSSQSEMNRLLKALVQKSVQQEKALNSILEGMGVTEEMLKVEKAVQPKLAVQPSANDILNALGQLMVNKSAESSQPQDAGSLRDVLTGLWA